MGRGNREAIAAFYPFRLLKNVLSDIIYLLHTSVPSQDQTLVSRASRLLDNHMDVHLIHVTHGFRDSYPAQ